MIVSLDELKAHLRIEEDDEDTYLIGLIRQAQSAAEDYCRVSFEPEAPETPSDHDAPTEPDTEPDTDPTLEQEPEPEPEPEPAPEPVPEPVRLAVLLMASFYFENRDIPDMTTYKAMRMAFESLLYPYRDPEKMF